MSEFSGFMSFGGNCVSDWARTNTYICNEDAQCDACGCFPMYINDYSCKEDQDPEGYGNAPDFEDNPAPWYDPNIPASKEFLGLYVWDITGLDGPPYLQSNTVNNAVGASLARLKLNGREMAIKGTMYATSCHGMDYGIRWINQVVLGSSDCAGCPNDELVLRSCCSRNPSTDPDDGLFTFKRVGVLDPPRYTKPIDRCGCFVREVTWSFFSELPYIYNGKLDTTSITFDVDNCESTWCNQCPPSEPPCKKDILPEWFIGLTTTAPADTWVPATTYLIGDIVYYGGYSWASISIGTGDTPVPNLNQVPSTTSTYWAQRDLLGTWYNVGGWVNTTTEFPPLDHYLVVVDAANVDNECHIQVNEDGSFTAIDFDLVAGIPTTCNIIVQNSSKFSSCEDPEFDSIFDSLLISDCACIPPFATRASSSLGSYGDWIDATAVIKVETGPDVLRHTVLEFFENPQQLPLPSVDLSPWKCRDRCGGLIIPFLPANSILTFDGRSRTVTLQCGQSIQSGEKYVYSLDGTLFNWIDVSCVPIVISALAHPLYVSPETKITIDIWERRL